MEGLQRIDELVELKIIDKKTVDFFMASFVLLHLLVQLRLLAS